MEIIYSVCEDSDINREQDILNQMYVQRDVYSEEERLIQSQKLDRLMNEKNKTFV